jgi:FkbM family methyltransferase
MMNYPVEMKQFKRYIEHPLRSVLDIGANIGQFAITLDYFFPDLERLDCFEPNRKIFSLLEANVASMDHVRTYAYGIGDPGNSTLFFTEGKSAIGSMIKENAMYEGMHLSTVNVNLINEPQLLTGCRHYDLVKIDVEGYELEVLRNITNITAKYVYVELSHNRQRNFKQSELFQTITDKFGPWDIC